MAIRKIRQLLKGRFVLIEKRKKNPIEKAWTLNEGLYERVEGGAWKNKKTGEFYKVNEEIYKREPANYRFDDPKVQRHLANGGNIGYLCGSNKIYVFDLDKTELLREFEDILGETLTIESKKGYHLYAESDDELYKIVFDKGEDHLGEFLGIGQQCIIPPSIHPSGKEYKIFKDLPIIKLTKEKLELIKKKFTDKPRTFTVQSPDWSQYKNLSGLDMNNLIPYLSRLKKYGNELYGAHPVHGSTTGMNFFINPSKGVFHCFRHDSGGDTLALISILEGICSCEDFKKGGKKLRGEDFKKTLEVARDKYNIQIPDRSQNTISNVSSQISPLVVSVKELMEMDIPLPKWIIKNLVPEESLVLLAGKSASMKSFLSTLMAVCCMHDKNFLGKYETQGGIWLYIDEDNPRILTKDRTSKILKGLEVEAPDNFRYINRSELKLDVENHVEILEGIIKKHRPAVVVLDSLIKFLSKTNENDSREINLIFDTLRKLSAIYKTTFLIIHHLRKSSGERGTDPDETIRGSTAIVSSCDVVTIVSRKNKSYPYIHVKQVKNRYDRELDPFVILIKETGDNEGISFEISANVSEERDMVSRAADEIYKWLTKEKEWTNESEKIFKTIEARERFKKRFNEKEERNRKIVQQALITLIINDKLERCSKGYYKVIDFPDIEEVSQDSNSGETESQENNQKS